MNDPEIIKKLDEIKEELSRINGNFTAIGIVGWIGVMIGSSRVYSDSLD